MALTAFEFTAAPFEKGRSFGAVGAYEELRGEAQFALDPKHKQNALLTDITLAPQGKDGRVHCSADVVILRPIKPSRRSRILFLDILNRGRPAALRGFDTAAIPYLAPGFAVGDGWLLQQGYTLVWCGWQHDVPRGPGFLGMRVPEAKVKGDPGRVQITLQPNAAGPKLSLAETTVYRPTDPDDPRAELFERPYPYGPRRSIPRRAWSFAPDRASITCAEGFKAGYSYELRFSPNAIPLTGLGFAATRDLLSFLRFGSAEEGNPCAGQLETSLAFGASQSGRFLRHLLYLGMCEDEQSRLVLDGMLPHIAGGKRTESNWRFGQPSSNYGAPYSPNSLFPFADNVQPEPGTGRFDGLQARAQRRHRIPKVIYTNTGVEYWTGYAALTHVGPRGRHDLELPENVRIYSIAGASHSFDPLPLSDRNVLGTRMGYLSNTLNFRPLLRAALLNLERWVVSGQAPPPSRYPRHTEESTATRDELRPFFDRLSGPGVPTHLAPVARLDFGANVAQGRMSRIPPLLGESYPDFVSALDADGNEVAGIRHPDVVVPVATYTGWNPRHPEVGGADQTSSLSGATIPFAPTKALRAAKRDPRPSLAERYTNRAAFLARIRGEAEKLAKQRLLLAEDIDEIVAYSGQRYDEVLTRGLY